MLKGIVEGFYGKAWSWQDRNTYPEFLSRIDYNAYLYAPKSDVYLRNDWVKPWPEGIYSQLLKLSSRCQQYGIDFGLGISPLGLSNNLDAGLPQLERKLHSMLALNPKIMAILFDDMWGDDPELAAQQVDICRFVETAVPPSMQLIVCPSYYSTDPVLEEHFGKKPPHYWQQLGENLSDRWHIFWTGQQVVSLNYEPQGLTDIAALLHRKPLLWDNYPVNDGRLLWPFINTEGKPRAGLQQHVAGVLHNPMNQAWCSKVAIAEMAGFNGQLAGLVGADDALWQWFDAARYTMQHIGLHKMTTQTKQQLLQCAALSDHPLATEVKNWLQGFYEFDPACLT